MMGGWICGYYYRLLGPFIDTRVGLILSIAMSDPWRALAADLNIAERSCRRLLEKRLQLSPPSHPSLKRVIRKRNIGESIEDIAVSA